MWRICILTEGTIVSEYATETKLFVQCVLTTNKLQRPACHCHRAQVAGCSPLTGLINNNKQGLPTDHSAAGTQHRKQQSPSLSEIQTKTATTT